MQKVKNSKNRWFAVSLALSIGFVLGVVGIPIFAVNKQTPLMVVCIVFAVVGFYGMPLCWIKFADRFSTIRIGKIILNEQIFTVANLQKRLKLRERQVELHIEKLLYWDALPDMKFDINAGALVSITDEMQQQKWTQKCLSCGAKVEGVGIKTICPYCGWVIDKNLDS